MRLKPPLHSRMLSPVCHADEPDDGANTELRPQNAQPFFAYPLSAHAPAPFYLLVLTVVRLVASHHLRAELLEVPTLNRLSGLLR
jgi:hypothetical protein